MNVYLYFPHLLSCLREIRHKGSYKSDVKKFWVSWKSAQVRLYLLLHSFLTLSLDKEGGQLHLTATLPMGKEPTADAEWETDWRWKLDCMLLVNRAISLYNKTN
jgi:hypothetical protein